MARRTAQLRESPLATSGVPMKRIVLFLATNLAVLVVLTIVLRLLGLDRFLSAEGIDYRALLGFSVVVGFTGSIISLLASKSMAKMSTGAQVIDGSENADARWLVDTVRRLAEKAGIGMPEVAVYQGEANAFATGAFKNSALVAVSTGLLQSMSREEVEAVLGHEVAHVANGDMVTLTLIQGVVNTFVIFLSRIVGFFVDRAVFRTERGTGPGFFITVMVCQILFGVLASIIVAWFSRQREFRADAGSASYLGSPRPMVSALARLGGMEPPHLPEAVRAFGINDRPGWMSLFSTHPPIEQRIAALQARGG
jgi:heat shock protein HtpX